MKLFENLKTLLVSDALIQSYNEAKEEDAIKMITDVKRLYNPNLHSWQYKAEIDYTVKKMEEILKLFTNK